MLFDELFYFLQLSWRETDICSQTDRVEPKFYTHILPVYMNVWRFIGLMRIEVELIRSNS